MTALTLPWGGLGAGAPAAPRAAAPSSLLNAARGAAVVAPARPRERTVSAAESLPEPAAIDDRELILRAQKGDEEAFAGLVERYKRRAYWVAYNLVNDEDEAKDVSQEAFIRVFRSIGRFDLRYKFYTWLYQIVTNLAIDALRKRQGAKKVSIDDVGDVRANELTAHDRVERAELKERVAQVLETLPPMYRTVITLREIEGLSSKEIAEIVGSKHATVRWRLHQARLLFKDAWEARFGKMDGAKSSVEAEGEEAGDAL
jgi:RNA polymerase sigma-70 factor (ECF subfamily)